MTRPLVSAALIVRNEERFLGECLRSVRGVADEVVVVDTGSTDRTPEVARAAGARLHAVPWQDDFAAARNAALDLCRGAWILYIDADERLRPCVHSLERLLQEPGYDGYFVRLHPKQNFTSYWEMRLFRNHPEIRFEGVIHENIWPALQRYMQARSSQVGYSNLVLDHEGYEGDQEAKHWRNLPLLLRALEADPARVYCWYHLGCIYRELGRLEEAQEALRRGIAVIRAKGWTEIQDSLCYIELIKLDLERDDRTVADLLDEARRLFPDHALLVWFEAQLRLREHRPEEAAQLFQWLLDRGEREPTGPDLGYDQRLFTSWPAAGLATCLFQQGRYAESRDWFQRAEAGAPDELEYRVKRHLCERLMAGAGLSA